MLLRSCTQVLCYYISLILCTSAARLPNTTSVDGTLDQPLAIVLPSEGTGNSSGFFAEKDAFTKFSKHFAGVQVGKGNWGPSHNQAHQFSFPKWVRCAFLSNGILGSTRLKYIYRDEIEYSILGARKYGPGPDKFDIYHSDWNTQGMIDQRIAKTLYIRFKVKENVPLPQPNDKVESTQQIVFMWMSVIDNNWYHTIGHPNEHDFKALPCEHGPWTTHLTDQKGRPRN